MGRLVGILVCLLVVAMDVAAGILGIQAEMAQNKVKHLRLWVFECREPSEDAYRLGLAAAGLLVLAHVIANLVGGCMCICSQDELQRASSSKQISVVCLILTWVALGVGLSLLVIGSMANNKSRTSCGFTHHRFLAIGGISCFAHSLFSVAFYVFATATRSEEGK